MSLSLTIRYSKRATWSICSRLLTFTLGPSMFGQTTNRIARSETPASIALHWPRLDRLDH